MLSVAMLNIAMSRVLLKHLMNLWKYAKKSMAMPRVIKSHYYFTLLKGALNEINLRHCKTFYSHN